MQTQCPHCETRFRVTESQVNAADGFVRCSVCDDVFNAFDVTQQDEHQPSLLDQQQPLNDATDESTSDNETTNHALNLSDTNSDDLKQAEDEIYQNDLSEEISDSNKNESDEIETIDFNKTATTNDSEKNNSGKDTFDFFDEDDNEPLSHVVPEKFKQPHTSGAGTFLSNLFWGLGVLLLSATLVIEYAWFNRDQLNQMPRLQTLTENLCQRIECKNIAMRNPKKIELISRNVYSHPNEKNALMINITMKNLADFAQPYPIMQIKFSDVRGGNVAARRFLPSEYLAAEDQQKPSPQAQLFEADTNMTFTMEIQDPGKQATTYEFDFL